MTDKMPSYSPVSGIRNTGLSRRGFLRGLGATGAAAAGASLLAACGNDDNGGSGDGGGGSEDAILNFANWPLYIDTKRVDGEKTYPTLEAFEDKTGIQVNYSEVINDNEEYFAKIRPVLAAGKDVGVDSFVLTDWMASKLINLGWLETLDKSNIPNFKNLTSTLQSPNFDENRDYSIPWQSGVTGIAYDSSLTDPITTISDLFTNPDLNGSITALSEMRDTMGLILLDQGSDPADFDAEEWSSAIATLQAAKDSGQIRQFTGNNYAQLLAKGDIKACIAWSGDIIQLQFDNDNIKFVIPDAGGMLWSDNMLIPKEAQHKANAEAWMNYYYDPKVAAELAAWVNYICPVDGAQEEMRKIDPDLADNKLIFPSQDDYAELSIFRALTDDEETQFSSDFQDITV
jgi:spermidine/putrescine transport system substrate-binding protein